MWKPAEKIKYQAIPNDWPDAELADKAKWFSPMNTKGLNLRQRTWVPAMVPWRASEEGFVNDDVIDWYARFARGKPGAIVVEATGIRDIPSGPLLRIGDDRFIPGLKKLTEAVRLASDGETRLFIQLIDFLTIRRRPERDKYLRRFLKITDSHCRKLGVSDESEERIREELLSCDDEKLEEILTEREWEALAHGYRERIDDTHLEHIQQLPQVLPELFAGAAARARESGFDGVELHYAHAYTMASFLSRTNTRSDLYGGSRENRVRLPLEVYNAVRNAVGDDYTVGCRFLSEECINGGSDIDDAGYFARAFAKAGMDFLSLSRGGKFDDAKQPKVGWASYPYTGRSGYECMPGYISDEFGPFGRNILPGAKIKTELIEAGFQTPVILIGGIYDFEQAEGILQRGEADIVGAARQSLADPDWFLKIRKGRGGDVRTCTFTNYCEGLDQKHKQVTCRLWDRENLGECTSFSHDGRRRLVAPEWEINKPLTKT